MLLRQDLFVLPCWRHSTNWGTTLLLCGSGAWLSPSLSVWAYAPGAARNGRRAKAILPQVGGCSDCSEFYPRLSCFGPWRPGKNTHGLLLPLCSCLDSRVLWDLPFCSSCLTRVNDAAGQSIFLKRPPVDLASACMNSAHLALSSSKPKSLPSPTMNAMV